MKKLFAFLAAAAMTFSLTAASFAASLDAEFIEGSGGMNAREKSESVVDGQLTTKWCVSSADPYVIFSLPESTSITGYTLVTGNDTKTYPGRNPNTWTLYGCNSASVPGKDSGDWNVIDRVVDDTTLEAQNTAPFEFTLSSPAPAYQYYMFQVDKTAGIIQLAEITLNSGSSSYISQQFISGSGGFNVRENADSLFDRNGGTKWCTASTQPHVIFEMSQPVSATGYYMVTGNDNSQFPGRNPRSWTLYGCNADSTPDKDYSGWNLISSVTDDTVLQDANTNQYYFSIPNEVPEYKYYMLSIDERRSNTVQLSEFFINYEGAEFSFSTSRSTSGSSSSEGASGINAPGGGTVEGLLCGACTGTGVRNNGQKCWACNGTGFVPTR